MNFEAGTFFFSKSKPQETAFLFEANYFTKLFIVLENGELR